MQLGISDSYSVRTQDLNAEIKALGQEIFSDIGDSQPGAFNKQYWSGLVMRWCMTKPQLKASLFRLIDVLPCLNSNAAIASHVREYLGPPARAIHPLLGLLTRLTFSSFIGRMGALAFSMGTTHMASSFIAGKDAAGAINKLKSLRRTGLTFTVDLLGEYCLAEGEAEQYLTRYLDALDALGRAFAEPSPALFVDHPGEHSPISISIKLTALYSQCYPLNFTRSVEVLSERLAIILRSAKEIGSLINIDAEDMAHNPLIYATFKNVFGSTEFKDYPYPGIVLQAYSKSSESTLRSLIDFAKKRGNPIQVRLVKGAYWDSETLLSAQNNSPSPLFSKKESSDAQYERLSRILIDNNHHCIAAFGSHNIRSLAHACCYAKYKGIEKNRFELQMLYGMAEPIACAFAAKGYLVRLYIPLGETIPGMAYLIRRLLENTSNESFLRHTFFDESDINNLLAEPQFRE